jgi:hypothetical protein
MGMIAMHRFDHRWLGGSYQVVEMVQEEGRRDHYPNSLRFLDSLL